MSSAATEEKPLKLIAMANQISGFFKPYSQEEAIAGIADHIAKFWDLKMRRRILEHLDAGGDGLEAVVKEGLLRVKAAHGNWDVRDKPGKNEA